MSSITESDQVFLSKIIQNATNDGLISGQSTERSVNANMGCSPCTICCLSGGRSEKGEVAIVIAIALFAISSLVGFFYTARSARSAVQAQADLSKARAITDITATVQTASAPPMDYPTYYPAPGSYVQQSAYGYPSPPLQTFQNPLVPTYPFMGQQPYPTQPYMPPQQPAYIQNQPQPIYFPQYEPAVYDTPYSSRQEAYSQAIILLEGHRNERTFAACAQAAMTIGAVLLTVALLISLIVEPEIETLYTGLAGAGVGFTGLVMWIGKHACLINDREQEAARNILQLVRA